MQSGFLLDVIILNGAVIFQLFARKDEPLLVGWDTFFVLNFGLDIGDGIRLFNLQSDGFASECLYKNLHVGR